MQIVKALMTLFSAMAKLPDWADVAAVKAWLTGLVDPLSVVLSLILGQSGKLKALADTQAEQDELCETIASALPGADGKFLEILKTLLPLLIQILPYFFKKSEPTPPEVV